MTRNPSLKVLLAGALALIAIQAHAQILPTRWESRGVGGGGAMFAPSFSPYSDELWVTSDMGELFRSTDLGASWRMVPSLEIVGNRGAVVRYTSDPQVLYTIDYATVDGADLTRPSRSTDGGRTWTPLPEASWPWGRETYALHVDPAGTQRLLASDYSTLYFSSDGGQTFAARYSSGGGNGLYVAGAFFDGSNIFVGTNVGLLVSTNGGQSFGLAAVSGIPAGEAMVTFAGAKQGATTRFFAATAAAGDVYPGVLVESTFWSYAGIYRLNWGEASWTLRVSGIAAGHFPVLVSMAQANTSVVYAAGQTDAEYPIIYKSTTGGDTWTSVFLTTNNQNVATGWEGHQGDRGWTYGGGAVGFAVATTNPNRAAFTDYGFVHLTTDGGSTWRQAYLDPRDQNPMGSPTPQGRSYRGIGLEDTSAWWLTWSGASNIFASFTDIRGIRSADGGVSWSFNYTGHTLNTMYHALRHPNGNLYAATSSVHDIYESTYLTDARIDGGTGQVLYSTNSGAAWQLLHNFGHPVIWVALDAANPNRLYASVVHSTLGGIFVSNDIQNGGGSTWTKVTNPPRTEGHPFNVQVLADGTLVATYSGRRNAAGAFTASSGVFVSANGGTSWTDRSDPGMLYWTKDLVVDPNDATQNTWYVGVFSGWGGPPNGLGGLYRTTNRGQNWTRILDVDRVGSCSIHPAFPNLMFVTSETDGLWVTTNLTAPSPSFTRVTRYPFFHPERVFFNPNLADEVWVTSFGHGLRVGRINDPDLIFEDGFD